jgi:hypothetical protein
MTALRGQNVLWLPGPLADAHPPGGLPGRNGIVAQRLGSPDMNTPLNPSPGSGWWQASDGQWYPQKWEHYMFHSGEGDLQTAMHQTLEAFGNLGSQG